MKALSEPLLRSLLILSCLASISTGCAEDPSVTPLSGGQLRLGSVLGETALSGFARAEEPIAFSFPRDHGPHPDYRSEWWYLTLVLSDEQGRDVGVQFTLFRQALTPVAGATANRWQSNQIYLAHFAITDTATGVHAAGERFARGHPELAGVQPAPFRLWLEDWRLEAVDDVWRLSAGMAEGRIEIDLNMGHDAAVPVVLQGEQGLSRKGPDQASYYFSMPGIPASGRIRVAGSERTVTGLGWLDREWSTSVLSGGQLGWDWLALQLDDGRRLMAFQLRREDGLRDPYDQGMLVAADGSTRHLSTRDFTLQPIRYWRDHENTDWPVAWRLQLVDETLLATAVLDDQLMATSIRYWEGMVRVTDEAGADIGRGYLELTGYDGPAGMTTEE